MDGADEEEEEEGGDEERDDEEEESARARGDDDAATEASRATSDSLTDAVPAANVAETVERPPGRTRAMRAEEGASAIVRGIFCRCARMSTGQARTRTKAESMSSSRGRFAV